MIRLTKKQILMLHSQLIKETGGSDGLRDENLLESAIETPFQSFDGEELYPSIQAKAARLCYGLVMNHAMEDGNKRIGTHAMLVFLELNGQKLKYSQEELSDEILMLASGKIGYEELFQWILNHEVE
ncbi:type II toxin-antitoxin system death-on-curing family toxin [Anaerosporobacter sp.]|uniref:type II toxin-antitoxin system death-on-curing family toxin n=1 Tax=Anaerosporobacter sp. TaxID=1872529 RepID=UPI00286EEE53|nr:type II toxin-antitoxin system death-on-curing family toxin [Anaerosporobacter sp.]